MRIPLWVAALSGVLGVGAVGGYYVALWQQQQYQVLLLGAVVVAILAWLGSGADLLGLLREVYKDRKEAEEKRKLKLRKHTKNLNEQVYKKLLHLYIREEGRPKRSKCMIPYSEEEYLKHRAQALFTPIWDRDKIPDPRLIPYDKVQFLERGISHLEHPSYKHIHDPWTKTHALLQERNNLVELLDNELTQTIRKKIHEVLPAFTEWNHDTVSVLGNVYYTDLINRFIVEYVLSFLAAGRQPIFDNSLEKRKRKQHPNQLERFYPWFISPNGSPNTPLFECTTEIEVERLQDILIAIVNEGEIMQKFQRISKIDSIEIRQSINDFEEYLRELVEDIDEPEDDHLIEGKCKKCEEWNK